MSSLDAGYVYGCVLCFGALVLRSAVQIILLRLLAYRAQVLRAWLALCKRVQAGKAMMRRVFLGHQHYFFGRWVEYCRYRASVRERVKVQGIVHRMVARANHGVLLKAFYQWRIGADLRTSACRVLALTVFPRDGCGLLAGASVTARQRRVIGKWIKRCVHDRLAAAWTRWVHATRVIKIVEVCSGDGVIAQVVAPCGLNGVCVCVCVCVCACVYGQVHSFRTDELERTFSGRLDELTEERERTVHELTRKHTAEVRLSRLKTACLPAVVVTCAAGCLQVGTMKATHDRSLADLEAECNTKVVELEATHQRRVAGLMNKSAADLQSLEQGHTTAITELKSNFTRRVNELTKERDDAVNAMQTKYEEKISSMQDTHAQEVEALQTKLQDRASELQAKHHAEKEALERELQVRMTALCG